MARFTKFQLNEVLYGVNAGVHACYISKILSKQAPQKEILEKAKNDLESVLNNTNIHISNPVVQRLIKYKEIVDLLYEIPQEDLKREESFTKSLRCFTANYSNFLEGVGLGHLLTSTYKIVSEKGILGDKVEDLDYEDKPQPLVRESFKKLIELADKYIELVNIEIKPSQYPPEKLSQLRGSSSKKG